MGQLLLGTLALGLCLKCSVARRPVKVHDAKQVSRATQNDRFQRGLIDRRPIGVGTGHSIVAEYPAVISLAAHPAGFELPLRCRGHVDVKPQMLKCVRLGGGIDCSEFEHHKAAIKQRQRARGVLCAEGCMESVHCVRGNASALCGNARCTDHQ